MLPVFRNTRNLPGILNDFFGRNLSDELWNESAAWESSPAVNIYEQKDKFEIEVAAPGLEKKDFKIDLKDDYLVISSERKGEKEEKKDGKVMRREFQYSSFQRSFLLPREVDVTKIKAAHKNGILTVELPKKEEFRDKAPRQIEIA